MAKKKKKDLEQKTKFKEPKPESLKGDEVGFRGGLPIDLQREMQDGQPLYKHLTVDIDNWLENELRSQSERIEKLAEWNRQYRGIKEERTWPYEGAANCAIPISRIINDAIAVRILDVISSQAKMVIAKAQEKQYTEWAKDFEKAINWWLKYRVDFKKKSFSPIMQGIKTGTGALKTVFDREKRTIYRYASPQEKKDKNQQKYNLGNDEQGVKEVITEFEGANYYPISREDLVVSSDATCIRDAFLVGFRTYLRKAEIQTKINQGFYYDIIDRLTAPSEIDETKKERAEDQGIEIQSYEKDKYEIWELWFKYDVDEDDEEDDIVVTWHRDTHTILSAIYNPLFYNFRPFQELKFNPVEFRFDGEGTCEILEPIQLEIDAQHNQRLDRINQTIAPSFLVADGSDIEDFEYYPGVVRRTANPAEDLREIQVSTAPIPSTVQEEMMLVQYAKESMGVFPETLGQSTAERPVFREAVARIQEGNRKLKFGIDNIRADIAEAIMKGVEIMAQHQPNYTYKVEEKGTYEKKTLDFPFEYIRDCVGIELAASSELLNQEVRREINLTLYQLLSDYMTKLAGMGQALTSPMVPSEFKKFIIHASQISEKILERVLKDFDQPDAEELVINLTDSINLQKAIMTSIDLLPPEQREQVMASMQGGGGGGQQAQAQQPGVRTP